MGDSQPPGFCFHPTDDELVGYYLKRKVYGPSLTGNVISETDPYKFEPWDLPDKSCTKGRGSKLYFFSPINGKSSKGARIIRATEAGYWKTTGNDQAISSHSGARGIKKTKIFYRGRAPHGEITNWQMHEYMLEYDDSKQVQNSCVLCKVFQKSIPKRNEQYGASSAQGHTSEGPYTKSGPRSSLGVEGDSLTTQPTNVINPIVEYNISPGKETCKLSEDSLAPGDVQTFLMNCICNPDLKLNIEESGLGAQSVYANQPLQFQEETKLEKETSLVSEKKCMENDAGTPNNLKTTEEKSLLFSSSLPDQYDLSPDFLEGDFIELNDLMTPLELDLSS